MKKISFQKAVLFAALLIIATFSLSSCKWLQSFLRPDPEEGAKTVRVFIVDAYAVGLDAEKNTLPEGAAALTFEHETEALYGYAVLSELSDAGKLSFTGTVSAYGLFFDTLQGLTLNPETNGYVAIYLRLADDSFNDVLMDKEWSKPVVYGGKTYYSSNLGISSIPLSDGIELLFIKGTY
ncbi:MAG: hypothetical protein LBQ40_02455 [Clostridiales bacterium]|jgi:hypothetical protein|nr:hypothetical protein [Clostridiales bacterium]